MKTIIRYNQFDFKQEHPIEKIVYTLEERQERERKFKKVKSMSLIKDLELEFGEIIIK